MSFYRPIAQGVDLKKEKEPAKPKRSVAGIAFAIVAIAIIVAIVVGVIIWMVVRNRNSTTSSSSSSSSSSSTTCTTVLQAPRNVLAVYNQNNNTAALSWQGVTGATRYRIYRKLEDPGVNTSNYDQRVDTINNSYNFLDLPAGTHYFVVTSFSSCGLESMISAPAVFSPSCSAALPALNPANLSITLQNDQCGGPQPHIDYRLTYTWDSILEDSIFIFRGPDQSGDSSQYFSLHDVVSGIDPVLDIDFNCDEEEGDHYIEYIKDVQNVPLSNITTQAAMAGPVGSSFVLNWSPIAGAEMYVASMTTVDADNGSLFRHFGGYTTAPQTSLVLATNSGDSIVEIKVRAFRVCNRSPLTGPIQFTPSIPPP